MSQPSPRDLNLESLHIQLMGAARLLDMSTHYIRLTDLSPETNVHRIGEALTAIALVAREIYDAQPNLKPLFLFTEDTGDGS